MISGHESPALQDGILQEQFDNFECLQHLILELVYTHPDEKEFAHSFSSETALFSIFQAEELLRRLLDRRPNLQQIVIKSNFYHPRFLALWDDIVSHFRDTPRVVFRLERSPREGHFLDASKAELDITARDVWQGMIQDSLEAAEKMWAAKDMEVSWTALRMAYRAHSIEFAITELIVRATIKVCLFLDWCTCYMCNVH